jgi:hypothetical protein
MSVEIRETIVTPDGADGGSLVQLQISDVPLPAEDAAIRLTLSVSVPGYEVPLLAQLQRAAMELARDALNGLLQRLAREVQASGHQLRPNPKP